MRFLSQRVQCEKTLGGCNRGFGLTGLGEMAREPSKHIEEALTQTNALVSKPLFEWLRSDVEAFEQIAAIER